MLMEPISYFSNWTVLTENKIDFTKEYQENYTKIKETIDSDLIVTVGVDTKKRRTNSFFLSYLYENKINIGFSLCCPQDTFDVSIGLQIALERSKKLNIGAIATYDFMREDLKEFIESTKEHFEKKYNKVFSFNFMTVEDYDKYIKNMREINFNHHQINQSIENAIQRQRKEVMKFKILLPNISPKQIVDTTR